MVTVCGREEQKMSNKKLKGKGADFANVKVQRQESNCHHFQSYIRPLKTHPSNPSEQFIWSNLMVELWYGQVNIRGRSILEVGQYVQ